MTAFEAYIALIKGYCGAGLLYSTKSFANGGYAWSNFTIIFAAFFTSVCAVKIIQIGQHLDCLGEGNLLQLLIDC